MRQTSALLAAVAALALAGPALAQDAPAACAEPSAPAVPDGATSTMEQMLAGKKAIDLYLSTSDAYQGCEIDGIAAQRKAAKAAKAKFDEGLAKSAQARVDANQKVKEGIAAQWSAQLKAYKAAHPS